MTLQIDEIRTPQVEVEPPREYFSKMAISKKQKEERVEASEDIQNVLLFLFALLLVEMQYGDDYELVYSSFLARYQNVISKYARMDEYIKSYIVDRTREIFDITKKNVEEGGWWTSVDRATAISENDANSVLNYEDLQKAIEAGYTHKTWRGMMDSRERESHKEVEGVTIPINDYFILKKGAMLFPHDWDNCPEECYNCRCSAKFTKKE